jgi:uncharacterized protein DUF6526
MAHNQLESIHINTLHKFEGGVSMAEQTFSNHGRLVPAFHFFALPVFGLNLLWSCYRVWSSHFSADSIERVLVAAALIAASLYARIFALSVQDRVILLEERLRFARLLPDDLKLRIDEFTVAQLVSLRFACDAELPALARKVLNDNIQNRKQIKQMVQTWRADYLRA